MGSVCTLRKPAKLLANADAQAFDKEVGKGQQLQLLDQADALCQAAKSKCRQLEHLTTAAARPTDNHGVSAPTGMQADLMALENSSLVLRKTVQNQEVCPVKQEVYPKSY